MNLINWIKHQIKEHKQQKPGAWKTKQLPEDCQQCELLGICRDIQNDWIAFVGADDVKEQYNAALNYDYQNWWLAKPEEERKSELEAAYARR